MAEGLVDTLVRSGALARLTVSLVAEELGRQRGAPVPAAERRAWSESTRLDEDGLGADSLARLNLAARLNRFYRLHESGIEDYLLIAPTLGEWTELAAEGLRRGAGRLTFDTSGSTGAPKSVSHALADLAAEAESHAVFLGATTRIVSLVPPNHIYGFLFASLGPALHGRPILDLVGVAPGAAAAALAPGDAVIATPFLWDILLRAGAPLTATMAVSSTAPTPAALWPALAEAGTPRLVEVHGSTETAGLGWRDGPDQAFAPLPHVERRGDQLFRRRDGGELAPPDRLAWETTGYRPAGRLDGAVQVGGVNVHPEQVRAFLLAQPGVRDCAVRLDGAGAQARLKAFVVCELGATAEPSLRAAAARGLSAPERPQTFAFGDALPLSAIGKAADWHDAHASGGKLTER